ncbi:MAG: histidine kinase [Caulobacterales bacterium 32-69-10]|nr:MAG: histidine kinase [Caulobacterales bacterium 32-69-10]
MSDTPDLAACDREPIHVPGAIQPHGMLLVVSVPDLTVRRVAGAVEARLGRGAWEGRPLAELIGEAMTARAAAIVAGPLGGYLGEMEGVGGERLELSANRGDDWLLVELEPAPDDAQPAAVVLAGLEASAAAFERAATLQDVCDVAAVEFRRLTGFDRVMVYRFLDDGAGRVLSEAKADGQHAFLHHHFPATDIPRQARALYVRNLVRVIPQADYVPAPLRPAETPGEPLDLSDSALRSVSPIHLQYLRNMGVGASASFSVVTDGALWGLIACHNETPRRLGYETRSAGRALARALGRQIKAKEEAETYRERMRLRSFEDDIVGLLSREGSLDDALSRHLSEVRLMLRGDGVAVIRGAELVSGGVVPKETEIRGLADWAARRGGDPVFATDRLETAYPPAERFRKNGSGVLVLTLSADEPWVLMWFRAEQVEVVEWAGNPHKAVNGDASTALSPRASFAAWREVVQGRSRRWTLAEIEAAGRLGDAVRDVRQSRRLKELNRRLGETLKDKDQLIEQKQYLIGEVNHRVQNSLQLVSSFLSLQARTSDSPELKAAITEANRRLSAVALVHRRLYRGDHIETVDAARYLEELCDDTLSAMGPEWGPQAVIDLAPTLLPIDRAISLGLVLTELMININKYAYGGGAGPVLVKLEEERANVVLTVADKGGGRVSPRQGFGSRMMAALVGQLGGELAYEDNAPGLKAVLTAPSSVRS